MTTERHARTSTAAVAGILACLGWAVPAQAAQLPDWVPADSIAAAAAASPDADAVRLWAGHEVWVEPSGVRRERIRLSTYLQTDDGRDESTCAWRENYWVSLRAAKAWHRDPSGVVREITETISTQIDETLYSDAITRALRVGGAQAGSIVAFEIELEDRRTEDAFLLVPLPELPTLRWEYRIHVPEAWTIDAFRSDAAGGIHPAEPAEKLERESIWTRDRLAGSEEEQLVLSLRDPRGRAARFRDWSDVSEWFRGLTYEALIGSPDIAPVAASLRGSDEAETIQNVARFVQDSFTYVQIYLNDGGWRPRHANEVLRSRYGDCKDMSHVMIALLSAEGISSYPALTAVEGSFLPDVPSREQFDHCIVAIPGAADEWLFFDPTGSAPLGKLPWVVEGKWALVTSPGADSSLVLLPQSAGQENRIFGDATITLDSDRGAKATLVERRTGHCAYGLRGWLRERNDEDRRTWLKEHLAGWGSAREIVDYRIEGLEPGGDTLSIHVSFEESGVGKVVRDRLLVGIDPWRRAESYFGPEIDEDAEWYCYREERSIEVLVPSSWSVSHQPSDVLVDNEVGLLDRRIEAQGNRLHYQLVEERRARRIPPGLVAAARQWDEAGYRADRESSSFQLPPRE